MEDSLIHTNNIENSNIIKKYVPRNSKFENVVERITEFKIFYNYNIKTTSKNIIFLIESLKFI